jgi:hypothetical protein
MAEELFAKVTYVMRNGKKSQAYVDLVSGEGTDKWTDEPLQIEWDDHKEDWVRVDRKLWNFNPYSGEWTFERALTEDEYNEEFVRRRANGKD